MIGPAAVFTEKSIYRAGGSTVFVGGGRRTVEGRRRQISLNGVSAGLHLGKVTDDPDGDAAHLFEDEDT